MDILFKIGDKVRHLSDREICKVLEISIKANEVCYKISSTEWDFAERKLINGHKFVKQEELEAMEGENE